MNETVTYEWTEELGKAAFDAFQKSKFAGSKVILFFGIFLMIGGSINFFQSESKGMPIYLFSLGAFCVYLFFKQKKSKENIIRDSKRLQGDPIINITITDDDFIIKTLTTSRIIDWDLITEVKKIKGFLCLYSGVILLFTMPIAPFSSTQIEFILAKGNRK